MMNDLKGHELRKEEIAWRNQTEEELSRNCQEL
jgi:hypothetical protein